MSWNKGFEHGSGKRGPSTAEIEAICALFRHPGWVHYMHYLRVVRRNAAQRLIYQNDPKTHSTEMARAQAEIRLIDKILADTQDASRVLAHKIYDNFDTPSGSPYRADDLQEKA
jgi:hypothetical protein